MFWKIVNENVLTVASAVKPAHSSASLQQAGISAY